MTTLFRDANWKIAVYGNEHGPPHFHVEGPGFRCSITIEECRLIIGHAPAGVLRKAMAWARVNRAKLRAEWHRLNSAGN